LLLCAQSTNAYVITFAGYNKLKSDYEEIISDLALADSKLQVRQRGSLLYSGGGLTWRPGALFDST
jgi:hypothetical protein